MTFRYSHLASTLRVLIADAQREVRSALKLMLEQDDGMLVSSEAADCADLVRQVGLTAPDVLLVDCDLPGLDARAMLKSVRSVVPGIWVVALCSRSEARQAALAAGADAFVSMVEPPQAVLSAIRQASAGRVSPKTARRRNGGHATPGQAS